MDNSCTENIFLIKLENVLVRTSTIEGGWTKKVYFCKGSVLNCFLFDIKLKNYGNNNHGNIDYSDKHFFFLYWQI